MNQFLGVVTTVDSEGNIQIPMDKLETAGIQPNSQVEIFSNGECVFIRTIETFCDACGTNGNVTQLGNLKLCSSCLQNLQKIGGE
jgi:bifunctional DNA-binding transcriptional regulator/antitoxin component of YhaV-PrlF toxin-antitoxin module